MHTERKITDAGHLSILVTMVHPLVTTTYTFLMDKMDSPQLLRPSTTLFYCSISSKSRISSFKSQSDTDDVIPKI